MQPAAYLYTMMKVKTVTPISLRRDVFAIYNYQNLNVHN